MKTYNLLEELGNNILEKNDMVSFSYDGLEINYIVEHSYLSGRGNSNNFIFKKLGIDSSKHFISSLAYGYSTHDKGSWPECRSEDYMALTRLVKILYIMTEAKNNSKKTNNLEISITLNGKQIDPGIISKTTLGNIIKEINSNK